MDSTPFTRSNACRADLAKNAGSSIMLGLKQPETIDPYATVVKLTF